MPREKSHGRPPGEEQCGKGEVRSLIQASSPESLFQSSRFAAPRAAARQASLSITNSWNLLKLMSIESVMPSDHLILCHPPLLLPSIFPSIRVFSKESVLHIRWPKYWSFSFSISPSKEYSGLISFVYICPIILFRFPHLTYRRTLPNMHIQLFFWDGLQPRGLWDQISASHIMGWCPLFSDPPRSLSAHMKCLSGPEVGKYIWPLDPLLRRGLAPLCSCHDCYFKASTGDKVWLFYPVSIVISILDSRQKDGYKYLTWSPPSPSFKKCEQEASFKCLAWSPLFSCPKKCKQETSCKCLAWSSSVSCLTTGWIVCLQISILKT